MPPIDYEGIFAREVEAIVTTALHERGIDTITEDELEQMMRNLRAEYMHCRAQLRRMCGTPNAVSGVRFRW